MLKSIKKGYIVVWFLVEEQLRKRPSRSDTNKISKAESGRPLSMIMKHNRAKACIEADLQQHSYYKGCNALVIM